MKEAIGAVGTIAEFAQLADINAVHRLVVERSLLADGAGPPQPGDFHHESSKQYPG